MRVELQGRNLVRNAKGDPAYRDLPQLQQEFTDAEIVELVNRSLYQIEYQASSHQKRAAKQMMLERPVKRAFKALYPHESFAKATPDQLQLAVNYLQEHPELAREDYGTGS